MLKGISAENLHHACLLAGDYGQICPVLISRLRELGLISPASPDLFQFFEETLKIDSAREIKSRQSESSSSSGKRKIFIIGANFFTREAANSLLKVFEEPAPGTHFFLITPNPHLLPATLKSRLEIIQAGKQEISAPVIARAKEFLSSGSGQRLKQIEEFIKKFEDAEGLKSSALEFLNAIEAVLYKTEKGPILGNRIFEYDELAKARDYMSDRGASAKMLLEHLALILPTIK